MKTEIGILPNEKNEEIKALVQYSFNKFSPEWAKCFDYLTEHSINFGVLHDEVLTSQITLVEHEVNFHGKTLLASGISYVASYPEARGKGGIREVFRQIFEREYNRGAALSLLDPFSYQFYQQFGYEAACDRLLLSWEAKNFPQAEKSNYTMKRMSFDEAFPALKKLHAENEQFSRGSSRRNAWWWNYTHMHKWKGHYTAICYNEEMQAVGYIIYTMDYPNLHIIEWVNADFEAAKASVNFINSHSMAFDTITYLSANSNVKEIPVLHLMKEPRAVKRELLPYMQARIVNVEVFLQSYPWQEEANFAFELTDKNLPNNNGIFLANGEKVLTPHLPLISCDIGTFSSLLLGYTSVDMLVKMQRVKCSENRIFPSLKRSVVQEMTIVSDIF
ncbi:Predicted acetyltransferase [Pilibacter termitis]|uniref:Predicted acetyltransferase n=1 Tax=Pilibacter termitis TaxID=263852 RepID=A0A1T4MWU5_9ENTE|nr:GNAT family N-acetyltransferase [Pilibacter termitis]SJZ71255.1 Predicted acetyltransferase [Pilibacter termitis]